MHEYVGEYSLEWLFKFSSNFTNSGETFLFFFESPHLVTDGAVVICVHDCHLHDCVANEESVTGGDVDQEEAVFLPVQRPLHIQLPLTLNQPQGKRSPVVPT